MQALGSFVIIGFLTSVSLGRCGNDSAFRQLSLYVRTFSYARKSLPFPILMSVL